MTKELAMALEAKIEGKWLREAVEAQGDSLKDCAEKLELSYPTTIYNHANGVSFMGAKLLSGLAKAYPTMNIHYVLTGVGSPVLATPIDAGLIGDVRTLSDISDRLNKRFNE